MAARRRAAAASAERGELPLRTLVPAFVSVRSIPKTVSISAYSSSTGASADHVASAGVLKSIRRKNSGPPGKTRP